MPGQVTEAEARQGSIGVDEERIVEELIFSQAEDLVDGIRELVQNGIDAPGSSQVQVCVQPSQQRTIVWDNGDGMDLTDGKIEEFLTHLGKSTKRDDETAVGQFGIGFGQALAKGKVTVHSQDTVVVFDAQNWFRDYKMYEAEETFDGFWVEVEHYPEEVPDADSTDWEDKISDIEDRFSYTELVHDVEVNVNGKRVSNSTPEDDESGLSSEYTVIEDDEVYIAAKAKSYDTFKVYSSGIYVTRKPGHGIGGRIVTKKNLDVNTARNSIKSGCELWESVQEKLDDARYQLLTEKSESNWSNAERAGVARLMRDGHEDEFEDSAVFKTANGDTISLSEIRDKGEVGFAQKGDPIKEKMADHGVPVMLTSDDAVAELQRADAKDEISLPGSIDIEAKARSMPQIQFGHETIEDPEEWYWEVAVAQILAKEMGIKRDIVFGRDVTAKAWTDGETYIALTEDAWSSGKKEVWVAELWRELVHEWAHVEDDRGEPAHGDAYNRRFRDKMESSQPDYVRVAEKISNQGVKNTLREYSYLVPDEFL